MASLQSQPQLQFTEISASLPQYHDFELVGNDTQTGVSVHRAKEVSSDRPVIIKSIGFPPNQEENELLEEKYKVLLNLKQQYTPPIPVFSRGNLQQRRKSGARRHSLVPNLPTVIQGSDSPTYVADLPFSNVMALHKMYGDQCNALVFEDFCGVPLREIYPSSIIQVSMENLITKGNSSTFDLRKVDFEGIPSSTSLDRLGPTIGIEIRSASIAEMDLKKFNLEELISVFSQLANSLAHVHRFKLVHYEINPDNIFVKRVPGKSLPLVQLVNFRAATDKQKMFGEDSVRYNYPYISPEQTGRTDRVTDYRTDMYSMGITMWELFAGSHPFDMSDPSDFIYAHLAKDVDDPRKKNANIPQQIVNIILKLVKKDPADRYQLASAVEYDLNEILHRIEQLRRELELGPSEPVPTEEILKSTSQWVWEASTRDYSPYLRFPQKPHGRDQEAKQLLLTYQKWDQTSPAERLGTVVILSGESGTGKQSFISYLFSFVATLGAYSVHARIPEAESHSPYVAIKSILTQLVSLLLSESDENLKVWEEKLVAELGVHRLQILYPFVPLIAHVLTKLDLNLGENHRLDNKVEVFKSIQLFLGLFATAEHPLVIGLDNLTYGQGSIELLQFLLASEISEHCFYIGYVDVDSSKPSAKEIISQLSPYVVSIPIPHLTLDEISEYLDEILRPASMENTNLAVLLMQRTRGNIRFIQEMLKAAEKLEIIKFDQIALEWTCDLKRMSNEIGMAANAIALLVKQLDDVDPKTKGYLKLAACIGHEFDLRVLAHLSGDSIITVAMSIIPAITGGYIAPLPSTAKSGSGVFNSESGSRTGLDYQHSRNSNTSIQASETIQRAYKFSLKGIQETLLEGFAEEEFQKISLTIAHQLCLYYNEDKSFDKVYQILKHFENAAPIIKDEDDFMILAEFHYQAGLRIGAGLPEHSQEHYLQALDNIGHIKNNTPRIKTLRMKVNRALVLLYIRTAELDEAKTILQSMEADLVSESEILVWRALKIQMLVSNGQVQESYSILQDAGCEIGMLFKKAVVINNGLASMKNMELTFGNKTIEDIIGKVAERTDYSSMMDAMLQNCVTLCHEKGDYINAANFCLMGAHLAINEGTTDHSSQFFAELAQLCIGSTFGFYDFKRAKFLGELALHCMSGLDCERKTYTLFSLIRGHTIFWSFAETNEKAAETLHLALQEKLFVHATNSMATFHEYCLIPYGKSLGTIRDADRKLRSTIEFSSINYQTWDLSFQIYDHFATGTPIESTDGPVSYSHEKFVYYMQLMQAMIYSWPNKNELCEKLEIQLGGLRSTWLYVDSLVCKTILICQKIGSQNSSPSEEKDMLAEVEKLVDVIQKYITAQISGEHKCKILLVKAEREKALGNIKKSIDYFEDALEAAQCAGNILLHAWINELYSDFWTSLNAKKIAKQFVFAAITLWEQWGSEGKVAQIMNQYPEHFKTPTNVGAGRKGSFMRRRVSSMTPAHIGREGSFFVGGQSGGSDVDLFSSFEATKASASSSRKIVDIDINTVLKVTNSITNETDLVALVDKILGHLMNNTGATRAVFLFNEKQALKLQKILTTSGNEQFDEAHVELCAPMSLINYTFRTQESKVYMDTPTDSNFANDPYIEKFLPKSILCCPIKHQNLITGAIYLENRLQPGSFTATRVNLVKSLMASASIAIANAQLLQKNKELAQALQDSNKNASTGEAPIFNVETPMQKAIDAIKSIKERFDPKDPINNTLDVVLSTLTSDGLFAANLGEVNDKDGKGIDQDTKNWIESSLLMTKSGEKVQSNVPRRIASIIEQNQGINNIFGGMQKLNLDAINEHLALSNDPSFNCFKLHDLTDGQPLAFLVSHMLKKFRLNETFKLNSNTVENFLQKIESSYNKNPYHNSIHATDVLQTVELLLLNNQDMIKHFNALEIFSICIASAIHDLDHPGVNNNLLVQLNHPLAVMYNDIAVLESHHVARAFEIAAMPGMNIFESMTPEQYRNSRKMIISIVLATDLAQHFQFISKFKGKVSSSSLKLEDDGDRHLIMEMAVKCGDLGNPVKTFDQAKQWTNLVMEEFFRQGDREKHLGLPVSKFYDRNDTNVSKCQIGFIDFLVAPLFDAWISFSKTDFTNICQQNIANNRTQWQLRAEDPNLLPGVSPTEFEKLDNLLDLSIPPISFGKSPSLSESRRASAGSSTPSKRFAITKSSSLAESEPLSKIVEREDIENQHISRSTPSSSVTATPVKII